jgi:hypothetical protein
VVWDYLPLVLTLGFAESSVICDVHVPSFGGSKEAAGGREPPLVAAKGLRRRPKGAAKGLRRRLCEQLREEFDAVDSACVSRRP